MKRLFECCSPFQLQTASVVSEETEIYSTP